MDDTKDNTVAATPKTDPARAALVEVLAAVDGMGGLLTIIREDGETPGVSDIEAGLGRDADGIIAGLAQRGLIIVRADDGR